MNPLVAGNQFPQSLAPSARLESLDILRGFDIFMIVGVIGANAIFAYMATALFWGQRSVFSSAAEVFLAGLKPYVGVWYETIVALGAFSVLWLILLHLYRHKIFLKI